MKRKIILILFICAFSVSAGFAAGSGSGNAKTAAKNHSSDPVKKVGRWFKHLFKKKKKAPASVNTSVPVDRVTLKLVETPIYYEKDREFTLIEPGYIEVAAYADDPENDTLVYNYDVSGGRLVGYNYGPKVFWDLSGVPPGLYYITAGADDGCGVCGKTITRKVVVTAPGNTFLCPDARIAPSVRSLSPGETVAFHIVFENPEDSGRVPVWSLSSGEIVSGHGTGTLFVLATQTGDIKPSFYFNDESAVCEYSIYDAVKVAPR